MRDDRALPPAELRKLSRVSKTWGLWDLALVWSTIAAAIYLAHSLNQWYAYLAAIVLIASRQNALATLAHEAWHCLALSNRSFNHWIGAWLYAYPVGIPYYHDRRRHLRHHRDVGYKHDPDWINYTREGRETPARVLSYLVSLAFGLLLFSTIWNLLSRGKPRIGLSGLTQSQHPGIAQEFFYAVLCQLVLFGLMWYAFAWWTYPLLWFLPLATLAGFFANFRAFMEHLAFDDCAPPEARLRDIEVSPVEGFLLSPSHFNLHALHHAYPSIPHHHLPRAKRVLIETHANYPFSVWRGYVASLLVHLRDVREEAFQKD